MERHSFSKMLTLSLILYFLTLSTPAQSVTIMSLDFGSEWVKIAIVAPGVPMEIALNRESKRKTPMAISFRDGERNFGEDALSAGMRAPKTSFAYFLDLLGKKIDNPLVEIYKKRFPYYDIEADPDRGTVRFRQDVNTTYSVEELVAQMLTHGRDLAAAYTNQHVKDLVITVPPFFGQAERRAMLKAAELADLKVLSLMSSNAAVALNYGMFRRKEINETAHNILFYDMGASSTTATIASYQTMKTKERGFVETNPQVTILGIGFDRTLGGLEMQLRVRDFLAKKFNDMKKTPKDVFDSPRALGKLMKAAGKVKHVLSANSEHICQVEGVLDDIDFSVKVTRQEFDDLCQDLFERVRSPVDEALASAAIDIENIHQFIIVGGNTRIPKVQMILQEVWGKDLGKNINADEAAALGAVYRAADLGQGFKVMKFLIKESVIYPIDVDFQRLTETEDGTKGTKKVKRSLFSTINQHPQKKVMTFNKHTDDFEFNVNYGDLTHLRKFQYKALGTSNISHVSVGGVTEAFKKHLADGGEPKGIKAHFAIEDSGILIITGIEATFEKNITVEEEKKDDESPLSKLGSTISNFFTGATDDAEGENSTTTNSTEETKKENGKEKEENKDEKEKKDKEKEKKLEPKLVVLKEDLTFDVTHLDLPDMTHEQTSTSKAKLNSINAAEKAKHEKEKARNTLESFILEVNDKLHQEQYEAAAKEELRTEILTLASQLEDWLYDEGFDEKPSVYKERLKSLEKLFEPIRKRVREHEERPEALKALHDMLNASSLFHQSASGAPENEKWFTDVELKTLDELIINTQKWIEEKEELQSQTPLEEDPKLSLLEIAEKISELDREIKYMLNKGKLAKAKKEKEEAEAKAKAEREAKEAEKKKNESKDETEEQIAEPETESEPQSTKEEQSPPGEDSRQEPPLPTEEEESKQTIPEKQSQENDQEADRRKEGEEELDLTQEEKSHAEL